MKKKEEIIFPERAGKFWDIFQSLRKKEREFFNAWVQIEVAEGVEKGRMLRFLTLLGGNESKKWHSWKEFFLEQTTIEDDKRAESVYNQKGKYLISDLTHHLENFLAYQALKKQPNLKKKLLVADYTYRNIPKWRQELIDNWESDLDKMPQRDIGYFDQLTSIYKYKKENLLFMEELKDRQTYDKEMYENWEIRLLIDYCYRICCLSEANRVGKNEVQSVFYNDDRQYISQLLKNDKKKAYPALNLMLHIADLCINLKSESFAERLVASIDLFTNHANLLANDVLINLFRILLRIIDRNISVYQNIDILWAFFTKGLESGWFLVNGKVSFDAYKYLARIGERKKQKKEEGDMIMDFFEKYKNVLQEYKKYGADISQLMELEDLFAEERYQDLVKKGLSYSFYFLKEEINAKILILMAWYLFANKNVDKSTYSFSTKEIIEIEDEIDNMIKKMQKKVIQKFKKENFTNTSNQKQVLYLRLFDLFCQLFKQAHQPKKKDQLHIEQQQIQQYKEILLESNLFFSYNWATTLFAEIQKQHTQNKTDDNS